MPSSASQLSLLLTRPSALPYAQGIAFGVYAYMNKIACFAGEEGLSLKGGGGAELQGNSKV